MRTAYILMIAALLLAACENPVDETKNVFPDSALAVGGGPAVADGVVVDGGKNGGATDVPIVPEDVSPVACSECLPGKVYRLDSLVVTELDGTQHPVMPVLNALWEEDIKLKELSILLEVVSVADDRLELHVVSAARVGEKGDICVKRDTEAPLSQPRTGCYLDKSDKTSMNIYAGSPVNPKNCTVWPTTLPVRHVIPVSNAVLSANFAEDCSALKDGLVDGVIAQEALQQICTCTTGTGKFSDVCGTPSNSYKDTANDQCNGCGESYSSLMQLLGAFGPLQYGCKSADGKPGVCLKGTFSATAIDPPPDCK